VPTLPATETIARYELRFQSLFHTGRALTFPCDPQGEVQWDAMTDGARASFLRAQGSVGRGYASPAVLLSDLQWEVENLSIMPAQHARRRPLEQARKTLSL
jgi:hypothetical protein